MKFTFLFLFFPYILLAAPLHLRPGDRYTVNYDTVHSYGGQIELSCGLGGNFPPPPYTPREETVALSAQSCGYGQGACGCSTPGQLWVPHAAGASKLCEEFGFRRLVRFETRAGGDGEMQCDGRYGGCFRNGNPGNIVCSSITCER